MQIQLFGGPTVKFNVIRLFRMQTVQGARFQLASGAELLITLGAEVQRILCAL